MPQTTTTETPGFTWDEVVRDPLLRDLPYKIETNARGQIIMSPPPRLKHSWRQGGILVHLFRLLPEGKSAPETPVQTSDGVKVPDVTWTSPPRAAQFGEASAAPFAPEICVEVRSRSNTDAEMAEKRALYFEAGAEEVWVCDEDGTMHFYDAEGEMTASRRAPDFPARVEL
jgi:Uma2 family endonuclease